MAGYCKACATLRAVAPCLKCGSDLFDPHPDWDEPRIPDVETIRQLAREVGYAVGVHGSQERDLDLIAAPWTDDAVSAEALAEHIASGLNGSVISKSAKPLGRWSCNIQIDGWFKLIDLSVSPAVHDTLSAAIAAGEQGSQRFLDEMSSRLVAAREGPRVAAPVHQPFREAMSSPPPHPAKEGK